MALVKNIVSENTKYEKSNSIIGLDIDSNKLELVKENLKTLNLEFEKDDYRRVIIEIARNDLLESSKDNYIAKDDALELRANVVEELYRLNPETYGRYLFYRYRYEVFPKIKKLDSFPPCLQIEPTSICNFRCVFCYQTDSSFTSAKNGHMGNMSLELFKKIIDEAKGKCESITLASRGEPLVNKKIGEMLHYMGDKFLATKMNTNASLLTEKVCHEILSSGLGTLVFSADAADEKLYAQLRVNGSLEIVLKNVRLFNKIKNEHYSNSKLITRVSGVLVNETQSIQVMKVLWGDLVDQVAFVKYNPWENTYERELSNEQAPCSDLWRRAFVWYDGRMNPCDVDYKTHLGMGNAKDATISEMWLSDKYNHLRNSHLNSSRNCISPCNKCTQI